MSLMRTLLMKSASYKKESSVDGHRWAKVRRGAARDEVLPWYFLGQAMLVCTCMKMYSMP